MGMAKRGTGSVLPHPSARSCSFSSMLYPEMRMWRSNTSRTGGFPSTGSNAHYQRASERHRERESLMCALLISFMGKVAMRLRADNGYNDTGGLRNTAKADACHCAEIGCTESIFCA